MRVEFTPACACTIGLRHLHVDGVKDTRQLGAIIARALQLGFPSETLVVGACLENRDRTDVIDKKGHHELNSPGDLILTTLVEPFNAQAVNELVRFILGFHGATIELEHVIGKIDDAGAVWQDCRDVKPVRLDLRGIKYVTPQYDPVEYHLALDLDDGERIPAVLELLADTVASDIMVGTWYNFGGRRLRSNRFAKVEGIRDLVKSDYAKFRELCKHRGYRGQTRVVAERVLGIWTSAA